METALMVTHNKMGGTPDHRHIPIDAGPVCCTVSARVVGEVNLVETSCQPVSCDRRIQIMQLGVSLCVGGSEKLAASIGQSLDPQRFDVCFAATGIDGLVGETLREQGFVADAFNRSDGFDRRLFRQIWTVIRRQKVQIVQSHHLSSLIYGGLPARLAGAKLVHTEHETKTYERSPRNLRWLRALRGLVHRFVAIDSSVAEYLIDQAHVPRDRVAVIPNGIDLTRFHPKENLRNPDDPFIVGWVGRLDPPKRPDLFIDAVKDLVEEFPNVRGMIVGPGSLFGEVTQHVERVGMKDRISVLGGRGDIDQQLQKMDCYVLCSDAEGLPISLVEAMASGLPCIASAVGAVSTVLAHGTNGLVLTENSPQSLLALLRQIVQNPQQAAEMGQAARQTALQRFDLSITVEQYSRLFSELVRQR